MFKCSMLFDVPGLETAYKPLDNYFFCLTPRIKGSTVDGKIVTV